MRTIRVLSFAFAAGFLASAASAAVYVMKDNEELTVTESNKRTYSSGIDLKGTNAKLFLELTSHPTFTIQTSNSNRTALVVKNNTLNWTSVSKAQEKYFGNYELRGGTVTMKNAGAFGYSGDIDPPCHVYVCEGAALAFTTKFTSCGRVFHLAGTGVSKGGAIQFKSSSFADTMIRYVTLEDDALVTIASGYTLPINDWLDLNGHTLTICGASAKGKESTFQQGGELKGEGDLVLLTNSVGALVYKLKENATVATSETSGIRLMGNVQLFYEQPPQQPNRPLYVSGVNSFSYEPTSDEGNNSVSTNGAGWAGPVLLSDGAKLSVETTETSRDLGFVLTLNGKISGGGELDLSKNKGRVCLAHPENDFTGGINFADGALIPLHPGALADWTKITVGNLDLSAGEGLEIPLDAAGASGWTYEKSMELANLSVWTADVFPRFSTLVYGGAEPSPLVFSTVTPLADGKYVGSRTDTPIRVGDDVGVDLQWRTGTAVLTGAHPIRLAAGYTIDSPSGTVFPWDANILIANALAVNTADSHVKIGSSYGAQMAVSNAVWTSANPTGSDYTGTGFAKDSVYVGSELNGRASGGVLSVQENAVVSNRLCVGSTSEAADYGSLGFVRQTGGAVVSSGAAAFGCGAWALAALTGGHGSYELFGGSVEAHGAFAVGGQGAGVFNQYGGTVDVYPTFGGEAATCAIGAGDGGFGSVFIADGSFRVHEGNFLVNGETKTVSTSMSSLTVCGPGATFEAAGALVANTGITGQRAFVTVADGGTLKIGAFNHRQKDAASKLFVNFDGGTFVVRTNGVDIFKCGGNPVSAVTVYGGGLTVDTDGNAVETAVPIAGATGKGIGTITLDSPIETYVYETKLGSAATAIGVPFVTIEGDGSGACAVAKYDYESKSVKEIVVTSPGTGYTRATCRAYYGTAVARELTSESGAVALVANGGTGSFTKAGAGTLTLKAKNTWGGATVVAGGTLKAEIAGAIPAGKDLVLTGGGILDLNHQKVTFASVTYRAGGGQIVNGENATIAGDVRFRISFDEIVAGEPIVVFRDMDLSAVSLEISGAVPALDRKVRDQYRIVRFARGTVASGTFGTVTPEFPSDAYPKWYYSYGTGGVSLRTNAGLFILGH